MNRNIKQSHLPNDKEFAELESNWRIQGRLLYGLIMAADYKAFTSSIPFRTTNNSRQRPYSTAMEKIRTMNQRGLFPGEDEKQVDRAIDWIEIFKNGWAHVDNEILLNNPGKNLSAIAFLCRSGIIDAPEIRTHALERLNEAKEAMRIALM